MKNLYYIAIFILLIVIIKINTPAFQVDSSPGSGYALRINIPSKTLELFYNHRFIKEYSISVGKSNDYQTPIGKHHIIRKVVNPIWEHPYKSAGEYRIASGPTNPLGKYWIEFYSRNNEYYGIHGTNDSSSIGKFVSHGCVRMHNKDIAQLFKILPVKTPVFVTYERFEIKRNKNIITLNLHPDPYRKGHVKKADIYNKLHKLLSQHSIKIFDKNIDKAIQDNGKSNYIYEVARIL